VLRYAPAPPALYALDGVEPAVDARPHFEHVRERATADLAVLHEVVEVPRLAHLPCDALL
jgi:hypothetical protein